MTPEQIADKLQRTIERHIDVANELYRLKLAILAGRPAVEPAGTDVVWVRASDAAYHLGISAETVWRKALAINATYPTKGQRLVRRDALPKLGPPRSDVERL